MRQNSVIFIYGNKLEELRNLRIHIDSWNNHEFLQHIRHDLHLICTEAFTNIVKHSYKNQEGPISLKLEFSFPHVVLIFGDQGESFDPHSIPEPSFQGDQTNGFGWYIIRTLSTKWKYSPKPHPYGWNYLEIYKTLNDKEVSWNSPTSNKIKS